MDWYWKEKLANYPLATKIDFDLKHYKIIGPLKILLVSAILSCKNCSWNCSLKGVTSSVEIFDFSYSRDIIITISWIMAAFF